MCCDAGFPRDWNLGWCGYLDTNTTAAGRAKNIFSRKPWRCSLLRNAKLPDSGARGGSPFRIQQLIGNAIAHDSFHLTTVRNMFLGDDEDVWTCVSSLVPDTPRRKVKPGLLDRSSADPEGSQGTVAHNCRTRVLCILPLTAFRLKASMSTFM